MLSHPSRRPRRAAAVTVCAAILWVSPGLEAYRAFGQVLEGSAGRGGSAPVGAPGAVPAAGEPRDAGLPLSVPGVGTGSLNPVPGARITPRGPRGSPAASAAAAPLQGTPAAGKVYSPPAVPGAELAPGAAAGGLAVELQPRAALIGPAGARINSSFSPEPRRPSVRGRASPAAGPEAAAGGKAASGRPASAPEGGPARGTARAVAVAEAAVGRINVRAAAEIDRLSNPAIDPEAAHAVGRRLEGFQPSAPSDADDGAAKTGDAAVLAPQPLRPERLGETRSRAVLERAAAARLEGRPKPEAATPGAAKLPAVEGETSRASPIVFRGGAAPARKFLRAAGASLAALVLALSLGMPSLFSHGLAPRLADRAAVAAQVASPQAPARTPAASAETGAVAGRPGSVPAPAAQARQTAPVPAPVSASITVDRQGATVGERIRLTVTLRNASDKPVVVQGLRAAVDDAIPEELELQGGPDGPVALAPGETRDVTFEAIPFASGELKIYGGVAAIAMQGPDGKPAAVDLALPDAAVRVRSVLTPDWKEKGFRGIQEIRNGEIPDLLLLAAIPLAVALILAAERLLSAKHRYPGLRPSTTNLMHDAMSAVQGLQDKGPSMADADFYAEVYRILSTFLADYPYDMPGYRPLPARQRSAPELLADLRSADVLTSGQFWVARSLAEASEAVRFGGEEAGADRRRKDLIALKELVLSVNGGRRAEAEPSRARGAVDLAGASGLHLAHPLALLLFIPFAGYLIWKRYFHKEKPATHAVADAGAAPKKKTWKQRLVGFPRFSRVLATFLVLAALAGPQLGIVRHTEYVPSTDTMGIFDVSGSMDEAFSPGAGGPSKLQAVAAGYAAFILVQQHGTTNRVGLVTFSNDAYLDMALGTDYAAQLAHLKELHTIGSTAIGRGLMLAMSHFIEKNIEELDDPRDHRVAELHTLLRDKGLSEALKFIKTQPDLIQKVLRPDRQKVMILLTDGDSNTGVTPQEVAQLIKALNEQYGFNARVYTIGAAPLDSTPSDFDEPTLRAVAELTGGRYIRVGDAEHTKAVFEDIGRMLKTPVPVSTLDVKDYSGLLAMLAFFAFALGIGLGNTKLRTVPALFLLLSLPLSLGPVPNRPAAFAPGAAGTVAQVQAPAPDRAKMPLREILPLKGIPEELAQGNSLYAQGKFDEAVKKYAEAIARYPDVPELYFNMGDAYMRLGDVERAVASWQKYSTLTRDAKAQSAALYNQGNAALTQKDAEKALAMYEEALRRDPSNFSAKWNLEVLREMMKEQQQQQQQNQQNQKQSQKHKGKQGQQGQQQGQQGQQQGQQGQQQGQQGQQQGQQGQQGQTGNQQGKDGKPGDEKNGLDQLIDKQGQEEKDAAGSANGGITREGKRMWGFAAPVLAFGGLKGAGGAAAAGATALTFSWPLIAWLTLAALPVLAGLIAYGIAKRLQAARKLSPATAPAAFRDWPGRKRFLVKSGLALAAAGLLGLSAAGPMSGFQDTRQNLGGDKDAVVAVDGSYSTRFAEDGRFERIKADLLDFISHMQGTDRVGLVVFAKSARTSIPLTIDYGQFTTKLPYFERETSGLQEGTDPTAALNQAVSAFKTAEQIANRQRVLILISDGEFDDDKMADQVIQLAKDNHIRVFAIGIGSAQGVKMKVPTADGTGTEYLKDENGREALTYFHEDNLRRIASATGGAYFPGNGTHAVEDVLARIAQLEKGRSESIVHAPRSVAPWFLTPAAALLLLSLLLPEPAVLPGGPRRRGPKPGDAAEEGARPPRGAAFGLALLPLSAWPQLLPFAVLLALAVGFITVDALSGRALTRSLRWSLQRRARIVEKGLAADLLSLYEMREVDQARLSAFMASWEAADDAGKAGLVREASADPLWREELTAAYLRGSSPAVQDGIFSALAKLKRTSFDSLQPVVAGLLGRRTKSPWLDHPDAARRLARLASLGIDPRAASAETRGALLELARHPDAETSETARRLLSEAGMAVPRPAPATGWKRLQRRVAVALSVVLLAANIGGAAFTGYQTVEYGRQRAAAEQAALQIFYAEDAFLFADKYADDRIPRYVLPALRHWYGSSEGDARQLDRAVRILAESPDPKADNILEALFKRADLLPMAQQTELRLMASLLGRNNGEVWRAMEEQIAKGADNPRTVERMKRMIALGAHIGSEETFYNLFHFLKTPNAELRAQAAQAIYGSLTAEDKAAQFFDRLIAAQGKFAGDPALNLWIADFAFQRLASAPAAPSAADAGKLRELVDKVAAAGDKSNAARAALLAQARQGQQPDLPPSYAEQLVGLVGSILEQAGQKDGGANAPLQYAAQYTLNQTIKKLVVEAQSQLPGLKEKLEAAGIVQHEYPYTRDFYRLQQARDLRKVVDAAAQGLAQGQAGVAPAQAEFALRADAALNAVLELGAAAGLPDGDGPAVQAADAINPVLFAGQSLEGAFFIPRLQKAGLAPDNGVVDRDYSFKHSYGADDLQKIRAFLDAMAQSGRGLDAQGAPRPLAWSDQIYLAKALESLDEVLQKNYPAAPGASVGRLLSGLGAKDAAARAAADRAVRSALEAPGQERRIAARLYAAAERYKDDARVLRWLARYATEYLMSPGAAGLEAQAAADVFQKLFPGKASDPAAADSWSAVRSALDHRPAGPPSAALSAALEDELTTSVKSVIEQSENAFSALKNKLVQQGLRESEYQYRDHYRAAQAKALLKIIQQTADDERKQNGGSLTQDQREALSRARAVLTRMIEISDKAGLPVEDPPGQVAAYQINKVLYDGYSVFEGQTFISALRKAGLEPPGTSVSKDEAYAKTYSVEDLKNIRKFLADGLQSGQWWNSQDKPRSLQSNEKEYLRDALDNIDQIIQHYGRLVPLKKTAPTSSYTPRHGRDYYEEEEGYYGGWGRPRSGIYDFRGMYGFAPLGLAFGTAATGAGAHLSPLPMVLGFASLGPTLPVVLAASLAIWAVAYALSRWLEPGRRGTSTDAAAGRAGPSEEVLRRFRQIGLAARRFATSPAAGAFRSKFVAAGGLEFAESSPYNDEDRKYIDWKTSAKKDELYVKKFEQDREMPLMLLVDLSPSAEVATRGADKRAVIEDVASTLALAASHLNIRVGAVLFSDRVEAYIPPKGGERNAHRLIESLLRLEPRGRRTDLEPALNQILKSLSARARVVLVSDLLAGDGRFRGALGAVSRRHDLDVIRVQDPAEARPLPDVGLLRVRDAESGEERWVDTSDAAARARENEHIRRRERAIAAALQDAGVPEPLTISTEEDYVESLVAHYNPKKRPRP